MDPIVALAVPRNRPRSSDIVLMLALAAWGVLEAMLADGPGSRPERVAVALALVAPLLGRRRAPLAVAAAVATVLGARALSADVAENGAVAMPVLLVTSFSAGLYARPTWRAVLGGGLAIAAFLVAAFGPYYEGDAGVSDYAIIIFLLGAAWTAGRLVRRRADQAAAIVARSGRQAQEAAAAERARIARELHDVVAHSVSVMTVQAGAAEQWLDRDPAAARAHLDAVRRTGREALSEMRRLVGVLREDEPTLIPQPGLDQLDDLVRESGLPVEVVREGERGDLAPGVELAAYRIVQEALTNVRKHAGDAPTTVRLRFTSDAVELEVTNAPGSAPPAGSNGGGHGLIGMCERARVYGGEVHAGAAPEGGFTVRAALPREGSAP